MNDIRLQDRKLFISELLRPGKLVLLLLAAFFLYGLHELFRQHSGPIIAVFGLIFLALWISASYNTSIKRRFYSKRYEALWSGCQERLAKFDDVLRKMRKEQIADLREMPRTIRRVGDGLYCALRRADLIANEVGKTEKNIYTAPPVWQSPSSDPQAKELYRIADKNIAEYRMQFAGVMAGVHRAEAQSAVFMTTLDSLRMKMIGYRLVGKNPEMCSQDFLEALGEAKLQLNAIDQALEELDFTQMPQMIAAIPPVAEGGVEHLQQGN